MKRFAEGARISLEDLINLEELQDMQDSFSEVANIPIRTTDTEGRMVTSVSQAPSLCSAAIESNGLKEKVCGRCLPTFLGGSGIVDEELSFECIPGLKNYIVPLKVALTPTKSLIAGYMILGPVVFMKRKGMQEIKEVAGELGMDPEQLWSLVLELRVLSYRGIHSLIDMVENLTTRILSLAYDAVAMQKKLLRSLIPENGRQEFLQLFLDLAIDASRGSFGSVMLLDRDRKRLTIEASRGLSEEVVRTTSLKLGDGIAGLAVQLKRPFVINGESFDKDIADRLKKPELFSSAVVPIRSRQEVHGVLNISSDGTSPITFGETALAFLTKAAGLAGMALERFQN